MHISEELIYRIIIEKVNIDEDTISHLSECNYCMERLNYYTEYLKTAENSLTEPTDESEKILLSRIEKEESGKLLAEHSGSFQEALQLIGNKQKNLPARIFIKLQRFIRRKPIAAFTSLTGFAAICTLLFFTMYKGGDTKNVVHVEAKNGFLVTYDEMGEKYWAKLMGEKFDKEKIEKSVIEGGGNPNQIQYYAAADVDNDGKNEVLVTLSLLDHYYKNWNELICYNTDGSVRWKYVYHNKLQTKEEAFPDEFHISFFKIYDLNFDGKIELYAIISHSMWYPTFIVQLDPSTGEKLAEHFHPGGLNGLIETDINEDGKKELLAFGNNNSYDKGIISVLEYGKINGYGPAADSNKIPIGVKPANEMKYILFPRNFPESFEELKRNDVIEVIHNDPHSYLVRVHEKIGNQHLAVIYTLDKNFNCIRVDVDDILKLYLQNQQGTGNLTFRFNQTYLDSLGRQIVHLK